MGLKIRRHVKPGVMRHLSITVGVSACLQLLVFLSVSFVCVQATVDPTSFACTTYNSTVIQVSWSMATDASVAGYYLYLQRTDGLKTQEGPGITLPARNYISYTFYGLGYYAQYDISINSYSNLGTNNTVYTQTCTTLSDNPDLSNFNLSCEGISFYEISCTWGSLDTVYWNGVPYGWQLGYISYYNDEYTYVNFNTTATLAYTIQNLQFDTKYLINIRSVNIGGFMGPYSSTNSKTLGWPSNAENATRYFCYEAIPGYLEFGWLEMPCTIYSGTIAGLLLISLLLLMLCCCMCCCKGGGKNNSNTEINIFNEERNEYYGDDGDDDDDYEESEDEDVPSEEDEEEDEYDDISDGNESPDKAPAIAKKKKLSDDEDVEESEEELEETEEDDEDSETDVEIYAGLTEDEKKAKKEERAASKKKKQEEKTKRREEAKKRKEEEKKRKEDERKEKIRERMKKRNAAMAGATTLKTVDETRKGKKSNEKVKPTKKKASDSEDDESEGYYEDWNPDADENPDVEVNKVSNKDAITLNGDKKSSTKVKNKTKEKRVKSTKNKDKSGRKSSNKEDENEGSEDSDEDYEDEDDETDEEEYDSSAEEDTKTSSQVVKAKTGKNPRKDSGRGSASSNNSIDKKQEKTNKSNAKSGVTFTEGDKEQKKKGGFLSNLFGTSKPKESNANAISKSKTIQAQQSGKKVDYGDWDDDDTEIASTNDKTSNRNTKTINKDINSISVGSKGYTSIDNKSTINGIPVNNHEGNISIHAPIYVNSGPYNGRNTQGGSQFQDNDKEMPPPGYGRNPNGTFQPLPGNFNRSVPEGYFRNSDGSIQKDTRNRQDYANTNNNPPPGYAKNFDGSFYPVRGNTNPVVPQGFIRNPDGTIYKNPQSYTADNGSSQLSNPPPGYGKNSDGTFYPLPGNFNPVLPPGYARNHDGTIYRDSNQAPYNNLLQSGPISNEPPPGYNKNPDGTFYLKPGNRNPIIPPGFKRNSDGSIYRSSGENYQNNHSNTKNQNANAPPGYGLNADGTYRPLPGNTNTIIPPGFAKDNRGNIYRSSDPNAANFADVPPPQGYAKNPDGSFRPLASNRNPTAPPGFIKNPDGSIFRDPYQNLAKAPNSNSFGPPSGYGTNADGTFFPLPSNRNPEVPTGYIRNKNGTISKLPNQSNQSNSFGGYNGPTGFCPTSNGTYRPLPGNRNPIVPSGYMRNPDGSIQPNDGVLNDGITNNDIPTGYTKNPDGTFRPLPANRNPTIPPGFTKNPDGTIRRNRTNAARNNTDIPSGYGKNADGTFYPLKSNINPIVPDGFRKNPDGTIARLPQYKNNPSTSMHYPATQRTGIQNSYNGFQNRAANYPYGPIDLDPPDLPDERDKFNDLFTAKAKRKRAQKRTLADRNGNTFGKSGDIPANFTGDGEDIFAQKQNGIQNQVKTNQNPFGDPKATVQNTFGNQKGAPYDNGVGANQNSYGNQLGTSQNTHGSKLEPNQISYGSAVGTNQKPHDNAVGNNQNTNSNPSVPNRNPFGNPVGTRHNANNNLIGNSNSLIKHQQAGQNQSDDPHDQSVTTMNSEAHRKPFNGANHSNIPLTGSNDLKNQQHAHGQNIPNNYLPINLNDTHLGQPNEVNSTLNPIDLDKQSNNLRGNPSKREGRPPFSFGNAKQSNTIQSNRKPISFRDNDPRYEEYKQRHPNSGEDLHDNQEHPRHGRNDNGHSNTKNNHGDTSDTEVLPDEEPPNKRKPIARFRGVNQSPAWGSKPDNNDKVDRNGKQTPITELTRQDRQELIVPEPVLGSDRLGNKFPFLNIDKKRQSIATGNKGDRKDGQNPENRRKSEPEMVLRGRELVDKKDLPKRDFPPLPNTLTGEAGAIAKSDDLAGLKPETRAQIFYGFGVGRWRQAAAKWLTKWKMKKKPVKTAKASWD